MGKYKRGFIRHDMFGHVINLNFNKNGNSHGSFIGGVFSVIIKLMLLLYVFLIVKMWLLNEGDTNFSQTDVVDVNEAGHVNFGDVDVNIFHVIQMQNDEEVDPEKLQKYVTMKYLVVERNRDNEHQHETVETKKELPIK